MIGFDFEKYRRYLAGLEVLPARCRRYNRLQMKERCGWSSGDPLYIDYHDKEWGVPLHEDQRLFEFLLLDGAQAGLSWFLILKKRESYRKAFRNFDARKMIRFDQKKIESLLQDPGIIRNRLKIVSAIENAKVYLEIQKEFGSFDKFIWQFTGGKTIRNSWKSLKEVPAKTKESDAMSKELRKRGFKFVGSTICYAFMQAARMVNDHLVSCFRYKEV
jgi:DNA-3-methyladenine glycosylase I